MAACSGSGKQPTQVGYTTGICSVCHLEVKLTQMGFIVQHDGGPPAPATRTKPRRKPRPIK